MKNLTFIALFLLCACKKEAADPVYLCPPEGDKQGVYMCADIAGHESFVTVRTSPYSATCWKFYDDKGYPLDLWCAVGNNGITNHYLSWEISYPFDFGKKITTIYNEKDSSKTPSFYVEYYQCGLVNGQDSVLNWYHTDSLSQGSFVINYNYVQRDGYTGSFEVDLGNSKNSSDRIRVTNGRFYLDSKEDYYSTYHPNFGSGLI